MVLEKDENYTKMVGTTAAILGFLSLFPLLYHVTKNKTTKSLNYEWMLTKLFVLALWIYYGYLRGLFPTMLGSILTGSGILYLVIFKYCNENGGGIADESVYGQPIIK